MTNQTRDGHWMSTEEPNTTFGDAGSELGRVYLQDGTSYRGYRVASVARARDIVGRAANKTQVDWRFSLEQE